MNIGIFVRLVVCILCVGLFLYTYISQQNSITKLRLEIPQAARELSLIQEENVRLQFEIDRFENPLHLMELASKPEFSHLKHPLMNEIVTIPIPEKEKK